jgi:hypothetical protein
MAIASNYDLKDNENKEHKARQQTRVISTKVSVDQHDRFNSLCKYLNKRKGVGESPTPSAILRHNIEYLLRRYDNEMEGECCNNSNNLVDHHDYSLPPPSPVAKNTGSHSQQFSTSAATAEVTYNENKAGPKEAISMQKDQIKSMQNEIKSQSQLNEKQLVTVLVDPRKMNMTDRILISRSDAFVIIIDVDVKTAKAKSVGLAARKLA